MADLWTEEQNAMFHNGEVWENRGSCLRSITQWIDDDTWCLLSVPSKAIHGGTCMMIHTGQDGKTFYTREELERRLTEYGWFRVEDQAVALIDKPTARAHT